MRADPGHYELVSPRNLQLVLALMDREPSRWTPIAGGTDLMVLYAAGKLPARKLVSIWNLPELRRIEVSREELRIGAGCTYTDLRDNKIIASEFPLLASAALPALLVYEAILTLVAARGEREVPYGRFHQAYKTHALRPDELIRTIRLPRRFSGYVCFARKVGARRAQAIAKVCVAALGKVEHGRIIDARIALGSVAPVPLRLRETEHALIGKNPGRELAGLAADTVARQIQPIDDIRSTLRYRTAVAANLVAQFVEALSSQAGRE